MHNHDQQQMLQTSRDNKLEQKWIMHVIYKRLYVKCTLSHVSNTQYFIKNIYKTPKEKNRATPELYYALCCFLRIILVTYYFETDFLF